jgi:hypothetical protein
MHVAVGPNADIGGSNMRYAAFLVIAISATSNAEDPFSCVDPDAANAFLGNSYQGRGEYSTSLPDGFAMLNVPASLLLVGSQIFNSVTTVVYKTNLGVKSALDVAINELTESGWAERTGQHRREARGFQTGSRPMATTRLK